MSGSLYRKFNTFSDRESEQQHDFDRESEQLLLQSFQTIPFY